MTANSAALLLQHYVDNFRRLPWRSPPGAQAPDPYRVWLSEVMLQQTTVAAATPRFERFLERWPDIEALANASDEEILSEWAGLGYYARARNLISCAREVAARGAFPSDVEELRTLPGIGAYTSAAIAAIAFGKVAPAIDTNIERVIMRLQGLKQRDRPRIERLLLAMIPADRPGDFVQALMDLGATICRARKPVCANCPLRFECAAGGSGSPETYGVARQRRDRPRRHGLAYWTERDGNVWLNRRPQKGILGGMAGLPGPEWSEVPIRNDAPVARVNHFFTHFSLDLHIALRSEPFGEGWWQEIDQIEAAGLPTLYKKAANAILALEERRAA